MALLVIALLLFVTNQAPQTTDADLRAQARTLLDALTAQHLDRLEAAFTDEMKAALPRERLAAGWTTLVAQAGPFNSCEADSRLRTIADKRMVITACRFERANVDIQFAFDSAGRISGLAMRPAAPAAVAYTLPSYAKPDSYTEEDVTVGGPDWPLPGTLTLPRGEARCSAVVLVHGSGPEDRDETIGRNKPFTDLALGLASRGIAVLRYEKRSKVFGPRLAALPSLTVKDEVLDDGAAAIRLLQAHPRIDAARIFVLGHSLGGMLVPRIVAANPSLAGAIVLAGTTRPVEDVIVEQSRYLAMADGTISPPEQAQIDAVSEARRQIKGLTDADAAAGRMVFGAPAAYWLDLRGYDPAAAAAALKKPLLVLQGGRDYQVTMDDFARWKAALDGHAGAEFITYAALDHLFIAGTGKSLPADYDVPSHVYGPVIGDLADWIQRKR